MGWLLPCCLFCPDVILWGFGPLGFVCVHADLDQSLPHSGIVSAAARASLADQSLLPSGVPVLFFEPGLFLGEVGCELAGVRSRGVVVAALGAGSCVPVEVGCCSVRWICCIVLVVVVGWVWIPLRLFVWW